MNGRAWGNEYRTTVVCVDSYDGRELKGRLYNPFFSEGKRFTSTMELLIEMEGLLEGMRFPQSYTAVRSFSRPAEPAAVPAPEEAPQEGACATFALRVFFRQNASWQGAVSWLEGGREESFRSVLELLLLMDSALLDG